MKKYCFILIMILCSISFFMVGFILKEKSSTIRNLTKEAEFDIEILDSIYTPSKKTTTLKEINLDKIKQQLQDIEMELSMYQSVILSLEKEINILNNEIKSIEGG